MPNSAREFADKLAEDIHHYDYDPDAETFDIEAAAHRIESAFAAHNADLIRAADQKWIEAFGAQDLEPRVTPESLAKWVFRDIEYQMQGLEDVDVMLRAAKEEMRKRAAAVCGSHTHANLILALPLDPPAPDTEVKLNAIKSNRGMDGDVDDNDPCESANDSRTTTPIGHVVGEGGECWCGETHENYHRE